MRKLNDVWVSHGSAQHWQVPDDDYSGWEAAMAGLRGGCIVILDLSQCVNKTEAFLKSDDLRYKIGRLHGHLVVICSKRVRQKFEEEGMTPIFNLADSMDETRRLFAAGRLK